MRKKDKKTKLFRWWYIIILLEIGIVIFFASKFMDNENTADVDDADSNSLQAETQISINNIHNMQPIALDENIEITDIGAYTGVYMEDGTDEVVEEILMAVVRNNGIQTIQYGEIYMDYGEKKAVFSLSTLPPGEAVVVLEKNRMTAQDILPNSIRTENLVFFREAIGMHEDLFEVTAMDGIMNIKNVSGRNIAGDIFIYYKNRSSDMYYGGITYRVRVEQGLADGELKQVVASHYREDGSALMMVTYSE